IRSAALTPGDDFGMMREVLSRRFKRLMEESPRDAGVTLQDSSPSPLAQHVAGVFDHAAKMFELTAEDDDDTADSPWPDLVLIDGGRGQLTAAVETLATHGIADVPTIAIAKGPDR